MDSSQIAHVQVGSDLYPAGITEDGEEYLAESYYVEVESHRGERWQHERTYAGCRVDQDEWGIGFENIRDEAKAQAEHLAERVRKRLAQGGSLDMNHWHSARPAYGSPAYSNEDELRLEAREEEESRMGLRP